MAMSFGQKKTKILEALSVDQTAYTDLSPKGSVDQEILALVTLINSIPGLVTTSSCAGRVSVYVEGRKRNASEGAEDVAIAGLGGKGGGRWTFVSHDPLDLHCAEWKGSLLEKFGLKPSNGASCLVGQSLVHIKFEPMVGLHS